jgi:hypothetical protein
MKATTTNHLDLDWADETDPDASIFAAKHDVTATVINPHGPSGGWPIVRFTGDYDDLIKVLRAYDPTSDLDPNEFIETA